MNCNNGENAPYAASRNVLTRGAFGTLITDRGGFTWSGDAEKNKLTEYGGGAFAAPSERVKLSFSRGGRVFYIPDAPFVGAGRRHASHEPGLSVFRLNLRRADFELKQFIASDADVKYFLLTCRNRGRGILRARAELEFTPALGDSAARCGRYVYEQRRASGNAVRYVNALSGAEMTFYAPGDSFIAVKPGCSRRVVFAVGTRRNLTVTPARALRALKDCRAGFAAPRAIKIKTPDPRFNELYALLPAVFSRVGADAPSGEAAALRDCLAPLYADAGLARRRVLACAGVRPSERNGELPLLPYITARYATFTGDRSVLGECGFFPDGGQSFAPSADAASLYARCLASLKNCLRFGARGLKIGADGREGIAPTEFFIEVIEKFLPFVSEAALRAELSLFGAVLKKNVAAARAEDGGRTANPYVSPRDAAFRASALARGGDADGACEILSAITPADFRGLRGGDFSGESGLRNGGAERVGFSGAADADGAAWLYKTMTEDILGIVIEGGKLYLRPALPSEWRKCDVVFGRVRIKIVVKNTPVPRLFINGIEYRYNAGFIPTGGGKKRVLLEI